MKDALAAGAAEGSIAELGEFAAIQQHQDVFAQSLNWNGEGKDTEREVKSPKEGETIVVVIHRVPRFAACTSAELTGIWRDRVPLARVTTLLSKGIWTT